ncbi:MAG: TonB-dependent receptor [Bacteroidota bacterium]
MHKSLTLFFCLIMAAVSSQFAQDSCDKEIRGQVFDKYTGQPLPAVRVILGEGQQGLIADSTGTFHFKELCEKEHDISFSYLGYKSLTHHHDYHHEDLKIYLVPDALELESIVIEGERVASSIGSLATTQLSKIELETMQTSSFGEMASQLTGVSMLSTGQNVAKPIIHGLHSNRVLVMNNGLRHEFQNWGSDHAPEIDASSIDNLEVVKGAATVRYGPDALGGVILVNSPRPSLEKRLSGNANLTGRSNGQAGEGSIELQQGLGWMSLLGGFSYQKQGDLSAPDYLLTNTGKEERSYYGAIRIHPFPELDIDGFYSKVDQRLGILRGSIFGNLEDIQRAIENVEPLIIEDFSYDIVQPNQKVAHDLYKGSATFTTEKQVLKVQYGYQKNARKEFGARRGNSPTIDLVLQTQSIDLDWTHPKLGILSGKIGAQWLDQENDNLPGTNTVPFIPNYLSTRLGFYLIESLELGNNQLEFGVRFDDMEADITGREPDNTIYRNTINYSNFSGTLGFIGQLNEYTTFRSNLGTAWRAPDVAELYRFGQHAFFIEYGLWRYTIDERFDIVSTSEGILDETDREVPAETGYKWIHTLNVDKPDFKLEASAYINYIQDYIYSKPAGITRRPRGFFVYFIYDQTDALFWGADVQASWQHHSQWESTFKGSYLWSKQIERNQFFAEQPPAQLSYKLEYTPSIRKVSNTSFGVEGMYTFEQTQHPDILTIDEFLFANSLGINRFGEDASDFDILAPPDAFFLMNAYARVSFDNFIIMAQGQNLLNTSYRRYTDRLRYFSDDIGRNIILSLTYQF